MREEEKMDAAHHTHISPARAAGCGRGLLRGPFSHPRSARTSLMCVCVCVWKERARETRMERSVQSKP